MQGTWVEFAAKNCMDFCTRQIEYLCAPKVYLVSKDSTLQCYVRKCSFQRTSIDISYVWMPRFIKGLTFLFGQLSR
jgi:hypothetical protein